MLSGWNHAITAAGIARPTLSHSHHILYIITLYSIQSITFWGCIRMCLVCRRSILRASQVVVVVVTVDYTQSRLSRSQSRTLRSSQSITARCVVEFTLLKLRIIFCLQAAAILASRSPRAPNIGLTIYNHQSCVV